MKDWLFEKVAALFGPKYIGATVRTLLAFVAGVLYKIEGLDPAAIEKFVAAAENVLNPLAVLAFAWLWSLLQKKKHSD